MKYRPSTRLPEEREEKAEELIGRVSQKFGMQRSEWIRAIILANVRFAKFRGAYMYEV